MSTDTHEDVSQELEGQNQARRGWSQLTTRNKITAAAVALVLAGGGTGIAMAVADHNTRHTAELAYTHELDTQTAAVDAARTQVQTDLDAAKARLSEALIAAQGVLDGSEGQVADNAVRDALAAVIASGTELRDVEVVLVEETVTVSPSEPIAGDERFPVTDLAIVTSSTPSVSEIDGSITALTDASTAVGTAQAQWAYDGLNAAIVNARDTVLPSSEGKVADENARVALQDAIDAAIPVSDAGVGAVSVADTIAHRDALNAAAQAVVDSQSAWQAAEDARIAAEAEAARVAAEQAAAAQRRTTSSSAPSASARSSNSSSSGNAGSSAGSSSSGSSSSGSSSGTSSQGSAPVSSGNGSSGGTPTTAPPVTVPNLRACTYYTSYDHATASGVTTTVYVTAAECAALKNNGFNG